MNTVCKIFVVLVFSLCVILMSIALIFVAEPTNWRKVIDNDGTDGKPLGYKQLIQAKNTDNETLRSINDDWTERLANAKVDRENAVKELTQQKQDNQDKITQMQKEVDEARDKMRVLVAHINSEQEQANQLARENIVIREQMNGLIVARDREVKKNIQATDEIEETERRIAAMKSKDEVLSAELGRVKSVLTYLDLTPEVASYGALIPPMGLIGRVLAADPDRKMVEISLGSDDGVRIGHRFEVLSDDGTAYLGRVQVANLFNDKAICENIEGFENGVYSKGNRVVPLYGDFGKLNRKYEQR